MFNTVFRSMTLGSVALVTVFFFFSCGAKRLELTEESKGQIADAIFFEDQNQLKGLIDGPVTFDVSPEIATVLAEVQKHYDMMDIYLTNDAAESDMAMLVPMVSAPLDSIEEGVNALGDVKKNTAYGEQQQMVVFFSSSTKAVKEGENPLNTMITVPVQEFYVVPVTESNVGVMETVETALVSGNFSNVYFAFDSSLVSPEYRSQITTEVAGLAGKLDTVNVLVAGFCDERGTAEYNLALGERRAYAVKRVLVGEGVMSDNIQTISFGEERPLDRGHDEAAWAKNRRTEISYTVEE